MVLFFFLSDCIAASGSSEKPLRRVESVEVVSILGDKFTSVYLGATAFSKKRHVTQVKSWQIDRFIEKNIIRILEQDGGFNHKSTGIDRKHLTPVYDTSRQGLFHDNDHDIDRISEAVRALRKKRVDTLVLVIARTVEDPIREATAKFTGYGIYRNTVLVLEDYVYAYYRVIVIDTRSGRTRHNLQVLDYVKVDKKYWGDRLNELSASGRRFVQDTLKRMFSSSLLDVLADAGLITEQAVKRKGRESQEKKRVVQLPRSVSAVSSAYTEAVRRVYHALNLQGFFEKRAEQHVRRVFKTDKSMILYRDTYRAWVEDYFSWEALRRPLVLMYIRLGLTETELNETAELSGSRGRAGQLDLTPDEARRLVAVWRKVADDQALAELDQSIRERRRLIAREAKNL